MKAETKHLLYPLDTRGIIQRQEVRTIIVRGEQVVEEIIERVFFNDESDGFQDTRNSIPILTKR